MAASLMKSLLFALTVLQLLCSSSWGLIPGFRMQNERPRMESSTNTEANHVGSGFPNDHDSQIAPQYFDNKKQPIKVSESLYKLSHEKNPYPLHKPSHEKNPYPLHKPSLEKNPYPLHKPSHEKNPYPLHKPSHEKNPYPLHKRSHDKNPYSLHKLSHEKNPYTLNKRNHEKNPYTFDHRNYDTRDNTEQESMNGENNKDPDPKTFGESLAKRYFVKEFIRGFRWGYKAHKRIQSVVSKCDRALGSLCPQPNEDNLLRAHSDVVNCIVEITNLGSNETCIMSYENDKPPPESTCVLEDSSTLDVNYCTEE